MGEALGGERDRSSQPDHRPREKRKEPLESRCGKFLSKQYTKLNTPVRLPMASERASLDDKSPAAAPVDVSHQWETSRSASPAQNSGRQAKPSVTQVDEVRADRCKAWPSCSRTSLLSIIQISVSNRSKTSSFIEFGRFAGVVRSPQSLQYRMQARSGFSKSRPPIHTQLRPNSIQTLSSTPSIINEDAVPGEAPQREPAADLLQSRTGDPASRGAVAGSKG